MRMCQHLLAAKWRTLPQRRSFNIDNLDIPIKSESDSSVEEQVSEAMDE